MYVFLVKFLVGFWVIGFSCCVLFVDSGSLGFEIDSEDMLGFVECIFVLFWCMLCKFVCDVVLILVYLLDVCDLRYMILG